MECSFFLGDYNEFLEFFISDKKKWFHVFVAFPKNGKAHKSRAALDAEGCGLLLGRCGGIDG